MRKNQANQNIYLNAIKNNVNLLPPDKKTSKTDLLWGSFKFKNWYKFYLQYFQEYLPLQFCTLCLQNMFYHIANSNLENYVIDHSIKYFNRFTTISSVNYTVKMKRLAGKKWASGPDKEMLVKLRCATVQEPVQTKMHGVLVLDIKKTRASYMMDTRVISDASGIQKIMERDKQNSQNDKHSNFYINYIGTTTDSIRVFNGRKIIENILKDMCSNGYVVIYGSFVSNLLNSNVRYNDLDIATDKPVELGITILFLLHGFFGIGAKIMRVPYIHNYYQIIFDNVKIFDIGGIDIKGQRENVLVNIRSFKVVNPKISFLNQIIRLNVLGMPASETEVNSWCAHAQTSLSYYIDHLPHRRGRVPEFSTPVHRMSKDLVHISLPRNVLQQKLNIKNVVCFLGSKRAYHDLVKQVYELCDTYILKRPFGVHNEIAFLLKGVEDMEITDDGLELRRSENSSERTNLLLISKHTMILFRHVKDNLLDMVSLLTLISSIGIHAEFNNIPNYVVEYLIYLIGIMSPANPDDQYDVFGRLAPENRNHITMSFDKGSSKSIPSKARVSYPEYTLVMDAFHKGDPDPNDWETHFEVQ